ncbi:MAG TPA: TVP38/TMEM64 family protein [Dissulfurispiraceae bacterium]|nr:TVP38/TMEM64 family protein [Dissulfurispiraceae bacterium]
MMSRSFLKKLLIVSLIAAIVVAIKVSDIEQYLTFAALKASQNRLALLYGEHRLLFIAAYMLIYILATSLSLPSAVLLTLAGGALFGLLEGTIVVSFASTIGATLACFVSRYLLRDWIQAKFKDKLSKVNEGIKREGAFYLFAMRLIPIIPFSVINLVMGLTTMPLRTFYLVSQAGMLPGTIVYVNAGSRLAGIESPSGILSPALLFSFVLLGLFPFVAKAVLRIYRSIFGKNPGDQS